DYDRANNCAYETGAFASLVPPDSLAKVRCYKSSNNPQQGCQNKTPGLVLVARMEESRDHSRHKSNYDGPENAHCVLQSSSAECAAESGNFQYDYGCDRGLRSHRAIAGATRSCGRIIACPWWILGQSTVRPIPGHTMVDELIEQIRLVTKAITEFG